MAISWLKNGNAQGTILLSQKSIPDFLKQPTKI
jgi:hypothetical protein